MLLSSVLAGEVAAGDLTVKPADWWRKHGVTLCYGTGATAVDPAARTVTLDDGRTLPLPNWSLPPGHGPFVCRFRAPTCPAC